MSEKNSSLIWWYSLLVVLLLGSGFTGYLMIGKKTAGELTEVHLRKKEYASICRLLEHDDATVVHDVAVALWDLGTTPDSEDLIVALGKNLNRFTTREGSCECAVALTRMGRSGVSLLPVLELLDQALDHPDREVRRSVAAAICTIHDARVLPSLENVLSWRNEIDLPPSLTETLAHIEGPDVYPLLYRCLKSRGYQLGAIVVLRDRLGVRLEVRSDSSDEEIQEFIDACESARKKK